MARVEFLLEINFPTGRKTKKKRLGRVRNTINFNRERTEIKPAARYYTRTDPGRSLYPVLGQPLEREKSRVFEKKNVRNIYARRVYITVLVVPVNVVRIMRAYVTINSTIKWTTFGATAGLRTRVVIFARYNRRALRNVS